MGYNYNMILGDEEFCGIIIEDITEYEEMDTIEIPPPPGAYPFMPDDEFNDFLDEFSKEILPPLSPPEPKWYIEDSYDPNRFIEA